MTDAYTIVGFQGKQRYDDSTVLYDDPSVFYDSVDTDAYTIVSKPTDGFRIRVGMATGLLIPLTYSEEFLVGSAYTIVPKPSLNYGGYSWSQMNVSWDTVQGTWEANYTRVPKPI